MMLVISFFQACAFFSLLLPTTIVLAQDDIAIIVGSNSNLAGLARQADTDVNGITIANTALEGKVSLASNNSQSTIYDESSRLMSVR